MKMRTESRALDKIFKRRDRYEIPDWQRDEVWSKRQKQELIDSILRGWTLPKFYFVRTSESPESYEVVDGQQRLAAIFEFYENELSILPAHATHHGARLYKDLPDPVSDSFDDFEIQFDEITDADDEDIKTFFQRLQQGLPLTTSERLNSVHSKLRDFCSVSAKHKFFLETVSLANKRYAYFDIMSKVAVLEVEGFGTGLRFEDMKAVFESQIAFAKGSQVAKRITAALGLLHRSFEKNSLIFKNRAITQSFVTLAAHMVESDPTLQKSESLASFGQLFASQLGAQVELGSESTDKDFLAFQRTVNANTKSGPNIRHNILLRRLIQFDPSFFGMAIENHSTGKLFADTITYQAERISTLIAQINETYSAANGPDLFKPTNKTTSAYQRFRRVASSSSDWKDLIDDMYFVFWEGPGSKLSDKPQSFKDINEMRTALQHDVDHGKAGRVSKRKVAMGNVFKKYSGFTSSAVADPAIFPACQAKLMSAVSEDLHKLLMTYA